jgi:hypothetical protein
MILISRFSKDREQRCKKKVYKSKGVRIQGSKKEPPSPTKKLSQLTQSIAKSIIVSGIEISKFDWISNIYYLNYISPCRQKWNKRKLV